MIRVAPAVALSHSIFKRVASGPESRNLFAIMRSRREYHCGAFRESIEGWTLPWLYSLNRGPLRSGLICEPVIYARARLRRSEERRVGKGVGFGGGRSVERK